MRTLVINEAMLHEPDAFHAFMASQLAFPPYYGHNLDALADCLGDVCEPVLLVLDADPELYDDREQDGPSFFDRACRVLRRAAQDNEVIEVMDAADYERLLDEETLSGPDD